MNSDSASSYPFVSAKVIAASVAELRKAPVLYTLELEYPKFIHGEFMTHRVFSRNAQSSRAIPVASTLALTESNIVLPSVWGKNRAGMSSADLLSPEDSDKAKEIWLEAARHAADSSAKLAQLGLHKQWANRLTEWFTPIKVVVTATDWDNFFELRLDKESVQPEMYELALAIKTAIDAVEPRVLGVGEWHLPYVNPDAGYSLADALKISVSCCAQVSYRKSNDTLEKAEELVDKLSPLDKPKHMSPFEHQARVPYLASFYKASNLTGYMQLRKIIEASPRTAKETINEIGA